MMGLSSGYLLSLLPFIKLLRKVHKIAGKKIEMHEWTKVFLKSMIIFAVSIAAIYVKKMLVLINLQGALVSTLIYYVVPIVFYLKAFQEKTSPLLNFTLNAIAAIMLFTGILCCAE